MTSLAPYFETAQSPRVWQPCRQLRGMLTIETEVAAPALKARPTLQIWGEQINDLSPLPPERNFRVAMMDGAKEFVSQMATTRERYRLLTNESELKLYGPGVSRGFGKPELDHFQGRAVAEQEIQWPEEMVFLIVGDFLAEFGFWVPDVTEEERVQVRKNTVNEWRSAEAATLKLLAQAQRR